MSLPSHSPESEGSDLQGATTLYSENGATDKDSNPKYVLRRLRRQVMGKKFSKSTIQRAIQLYDLEKSYDSQSPEVMAKLERLFGINNIKWPPEHEDMTSEMWTTDHINPLQTDPDQRDHYVYHPMLKISGLRGDIREQHRVDSCPYLKRAAG